MLPLSLAIMSLTVRAIPPALPGMRLCDPLRSIIRPPQIEQLRAEIRGMKEDFKNLKASIIRSFRTQRDARPPHRATQQATGRPQPEVFNTNPSMNPSTTDFEHIAIDALSQLEARFDQFDKKIENARVSAYPPPSADAPAQRGRSGRKQISPQTTSGKDKHRAAAESQQAEIHPFADKRIQRMRRLPLPVGWTRNVGDGNTEICLSSRLNVWR
ncbi:hypothetical protein N658DRAFT_562793 [Parathielavia hyrcaniae]|uniref:Uncharacterized protein n=1 Tax=Parathielavia hyrcaniae TaxID=113614 RepID=A0AAN6PRW4_9PEZI|nr:hypothetical protein N658DRAFT_562793 [Parathielavia hyrcaniae]